jgi:hypothetical protein
MFCALAVHHIAVFCVMTPCSPVGGYQCVRGTQCQHNWGIREGGEVFFPEKFVILSTINRETENVVK